MPAPFANVLPQTDKAAPGAFPAVAFFLVAALFFDLLSDLTAGLFDAGTSDFSSCLI
ncbi:hypothetical protein TP51_004792, partial [Salmonella enterica subsp. enterica]|nr:hypothetical protein [Salmonella enterica subsp. enterica serovar Miami]